MSIADHWPLFSLRIRTSDLELFVPTDDELAELLEVAARGIHDPVTMPFAVPWTDIASPEFERAALQYHWRCRAEFSPTRWDLGFAVRREGRIVGMQALHSVDFPIVRSVETGSWLGKEFQGHGIGTAMRAAAVQFAFEFLGALTVTSGAFEDNLASQRVSLAIGYEPNGVSATVRRGERASQRRFLLTRERWQSTRTDLDLPVDVSGYESCRKLLGT